MGREDNFSGDTRDGAVEIQALLLHAASNRFEDGKTAVPLVQVQNAWRDAHRLQSAETAHTQQQFLAYSKAAITSVEPRCEFPIFRRVSFDIRIEQKQGAAPYLKAPDLGTDRPAPRLNLHGNRLALRPDCRFHGHLADVRLEVLFLLPAVLVQPLPEIALPIKQADANQRKSQVRCALDVVSGKDTEAAGINGKRLVQAEFQGEIGNRARPQNAGVPRAPCA